MLSIHLSSFWRGQYKNLPLHHLGQWGRPPSAPWLSTVHLSKVASPATLALPLPNVLWLTMCSNKGTRPLLENYGLAIPLTSIYPGEVCVCVCIHRYIQVYIYTCKQPCIRMFIAFLLMKAPNLEKLQVFINLGVNRQTIYIHTMEYYSAKPKRQTKKLLIHTTTQIHFKDILLRERSQLQKSTCCVVSFTWRL